MDSTCWRIRGSYCSSKKLIREVIKIPNLPLNQDIEKLKDARDKLAAVYKNEATDDVFDNGNLSTLNSAILNVENVIKMLEER